MSSSLPLQEFIEGACSPIRFEPDISLNLEICEMVNRKAGNAPREAAIHIVRLVNSRNMNVAMQALTLLDNCVKNCGYPFHLQISTKEFLNELVRKFPERPNPIPEPVTQRILYLIKEWKVTLADNARHKEDLVHIKDMYRLLRFKGYRFPELRIDSAAALQPSENLKSPEELEEEDRIAQAAKLQELIRRGRPQDLVEANELMKIMAGYDQRRRPNYKQQANEELDKIRQKAILLNDMLQNVKPGEKIDRNETLQELKESCRNAQPKIQKFVTEEEDPENIEQLLALNDMINGVMQKYEDIRRGIFDTRYDMQQPTSGVAAQPTPAAQQQQQQQASLIDFDGDFGASTGGRRPSGNAPGAGKQTGNGTGSLIDDLLGLSFDDNPGGFGIGGSIALSTGVSPVIGPNTIPILASPSTYIAPPSHGTPKTQASATATDLLGIAGRTPASVPTPPSSGTLRPVSPLTIESPTQKPAEASGEIVLLDKNGIRITFDAKYVLDTLHLRAKFSNASTAPMLGLELKIAVPKSMKLVMETQSSDTIPPQTTNAVTQLIHIKNENKSDIRVRYQVNYVQNGVSMEQSGEFSGFPKPPA